MRLLRRGVLFRTAWPHRYASETETMQQIADRAFGKLYPVALLDRLREVDPPPAHHTMGGQIRSIANKLCHLLFLLPRQLRLGSRSGSVVQPAQTFGVIAVHPVAEY